ncbi:hypothetical protein GCM10010228_54840 [Streptomyces massasporeus]|nr:hypothetical protein GCM10010228_54840 [Streptomyces massasporeus]
MYEPPPRKDSGSDRVLDDSFVIAPRYQMAPSRRATATYSPIGGLPAVARRDLHAG